MGNNALLGNRIEKEILTDKKEEGILLIRKQAVETADT